MREDSLDKKIINIFKPNQQISIFFNAAKDSQKVREQQEQRAIEKKMQKEHEEKQLRVKAPESEPQKTSGQEQRKAQEQVQQKAQEQQKAQGQMQQKAQGQVQQKVQEQGQQIVYQSSIELVTANNMEISAPVRQGVQVFLEKGDNFSIRVKLRNETYEFKSSYIYRRIGQNPVWVIQTPYEGKKIQQRIYPRINFSAVVNAWSVKKLDQNQPPRLPQKQDATFLLTKDISAGGLRVISKLPYSLNSQLNLSFELPDYGEIKALGQVLRVQTYKHENMTLFFNGIRFLDISEKDSQALDEFIAKKQREIN